MQIINSLLVIGFLVFLIGYIHALVRPKHPSVVKRFGENTTRKTITKSFLPLLVVIFVFIGITAPSSQADQRQTAQTPSTTKISSTPPAPKAEVKIVTDTSPIPFTSSTINDNTLTQGATKIQTTGVDGVVTHTYRVTYTNGVETSRTSPVDTITTPVVNQVTVIGTYVAPAPISTHVSTPAPSCPNGTYVNSAGNTVCSPYASPSAPVGATAQCVDGTYSFSKTHSGTCSHHGGVATWL
jgi:hypothetical protein